MEESIPASPHPEEAAWSPHSAAVRSPRAEEEHRVSVQMLQINTLFFAFAALFVQLKFQQRPTEEEEGGRATGITPTHRHPRPARGALQGLVEYGLGTRQGPTGSVLKKRSL